MITSIQKDKLPRRTRPPKKRERIQSIYQFLETQGGWVSTEKIHNEFQWIKRTLRATLAAMVEQGLIKKVRSLQDTRVALYTVNSEHN